MIQLQIPATSANLGAGFDSLGLALSLYNRLGLEPWDRVVVEAPPGAPIPTGRHNLIYKTVKHLYDHCGRPLPGLRIVQRDAIPMARGLGSSSACIVGGLVGGNRLLGEPLSQQELLDMASALEGHPDNAAPALLGGLVTAVLEDGRVHYCRQSLAGDLGFVAVIPDFQLRTSQARAVLPEQVTRQDAVFNLSRAALTAVSLATGQYQNLRVSLEDRLHQPTRLGLIPQGRQVLDHCLALGAYGAYLSGAGPTLMAVVPAGSAGFVRELRDFLDRSGLASWQAVLLEPDNRGAAVVDE